MPVTQVSGMSFPAFPWLPGVLGLGAGIRFNAHHGTSTIARVREGPNNLTLLYSWEMQGLDFLEPWQPGNCQLLLDALFTCIRKLLQYLKKERKKKFSFLYLTDTSRVVSVYG